MEAYNAICYHLAAHGYPPSMRELGAAMGLRGPTFVRQTLEVLEAKGWIRWDRIVARGLHVLGPGTFARRAQARPVTVGRVAPVLPCVLCGQRIVYSRDGHPAPAHVRACPARQRQAVGA